MKELDLGIELSKNEQKKVFGGHVYCDGGHVGLDVACVDGPAYCAYFNQGFDYCDT